MTDEEKLGKHIDDLIKCFNDYYKEYRLRYIAGKGDKRTLCRVLAGCAFGIAQDLNELEKCIEVEE